MQSPASYPNPSQLVKKQPKKIVLILILVIMVMCIISTVAFLVFSYREFQRSPKLVEGAKVRSGAPTLYSLSAEQSEVINRLGQPDSFSIMFYREEFDPSYDGEVRDEVWRYYKEGIAYTFYNGALTYEEPISSPQTSWIVPVYTPAQFTANASLTTILATTGIRDYFELPLEDELIDGGTLYYAPGLTFGLANDQLIYVETISMTESMGDNNE